MGIAPPAQGSAQPPAVRWPGERHNRRIGKTRARVEHVFGALAPMGGKLIRTIGQGQANFALTLMAACYNLKRLVYLKVAGVMVL
jgi:transposase, IS5 family